MPLRILLFLLPAACFAQAGKAELFGTILDPSGLPVARVKIEATHTSDSARFSATSNDRGQYHLLGLPAGDYVFTAQATGFRPYTRSGIVLRISDQVELNVKLQIGPATQSIEVTAAAPLLQTASGEVAESVDAVKVSTLPLDGRNFIPLVALSPGVALPGGGSLLPRINGSRPRTNEYIYDGISVLQPEPGQVPFYPIVDGIAEFRLNVNSYSAEYGRSNGGTVMVSTKSGGNDLHGTLFEFLRNEDLNAVNYFAHLPPQPAHPEFRRNQFGGAAGGPIQKNKTFFFGDWQSTRQLTGVTRFSTVPTPVQIAALESSLAGRLDPLAQKVLERYPAPNRSGTANNFVRAGVEPDSPDQFDGRIDRIFGAKHRVFTRYSYLRDDDDPVTPLPDGSGLISSGATGHAITRGDGIVAEHDWALSPDTLNQARFGYSRRDLHQTSLQDGNLSIPGLPANAFASVLPIFALAGYQQIGPTSGANSNFSTSITEYQDTFSRVKGAHTIKLGAEVRREALEVLNPPNPTGTFAFTAAGNGDPLASLLLGQVNAFSIDIQNQALQERAHFAEFFATDEWKISPRLTASIGTRYTLNFPSTEVHNHGAIFNLKTQVLDFPHTARELECCDFGPRLGLAYRLADTWVLRSGYGMIWFEQSGITTPFTLPQFPFVQTLGQQSQDNVNPAFLLANGPTVQVTPPNPNSGLGQGVFGVDRNTGSGYSQQWNFTVQKTFGENLNLEVGYLGSKNTRLGVPDANINQLPTADLAMGPALLAKVPNPFQGQIPASSSLGGATLTAQQLLRPYPRFTTVALFRDNIGNSGYQAVEAKLEKRLSHGLTFSFAYTFSKLLDDASAVFSNTIFTGPIANTGVADAYNRHLEKDLSQGDIPRVFSAGWVYRIPRIWKISGWEIGGLVRIQSGDMVQVSQATNFNSNLGFGVERPNRTADPNSFSARTPNEWFNISDFTQAGQFNIGNSSRNPVRGPGLQNADVMLGKTFRITERLGLEIRAEAFNVSNTPPFNDPNGVFTPPVLLPSGTTAPRTFGSIITAGNPRDFEFAAKLHF